MIALPPAYVQVLSLGLLWTSVHCSSMCGPLLCGLQIGGANPAHRTSLGRGIRGVLCYQLGRGLTYAWLGGLAGLLGAGLGRAFTTAGGILALLFGLALLYSVRPQRPELVRLRRRTDASLVAIAVSRLRALLVPLLQSTHVLRDLVLGSMMGLLPCMIPAWALGQAATTGSPFHGAVIMLLLVLLTTPVLLITTQLPRLGRALPRRLRECAARWLPAISGTWLLLVGGAGVGLWPHQHLGVSLLGQSFMMMLY